MSHELRTPLNAVLGFSELIRDGLDPAANARFVGYAADIHGAGKHLLDVINNILDQATIERGRMELHESIVDFATLIGGVEGMLAAQSRAAGIELQGSVAPNVPQILGDPVRLRQVLLNLAYNAIKFTPHGGLVRTEAREESSGDVSIVVSDNGIGMRLEDIPRALEPFGQIETNLARRFGGSGLGLPIAKALVELHGGTLNIQSALGQGTTVTVLLPAERVRRHRSGEV